MISLVRPRPFQWQVHQTVRVPESECSLDLSLPQLVASHDCCFVVIVVIVVVDVDVVEDDANDAQMSKETDDIKCIHTRQQKKMHASYNFLPKISMLSNGCQEQDVGFWFQYDPRCRLHALE